MRILLPLLLLVLASDAQFGVRRSSSTTRKPAATWIRSKVTRVQEWVGWRKRGSTTTAAPSRTAETERRGLVGRVRDGLDGRSRGSSEVASTRRSIVGRVKDRLGWTTPDPLMVTTSSRGLIGRVKDKLGFGRPTSTVSPSVVALGGTRGKMGVLPLPIPIPIPHTSHDDPSTNDPMSESSLTSTSESPKKSLLERAKEKLGFSTTTVSPVDAPSEPSDTPVPEPRGFFGRAFDKLKSVLHIGSTDPEKPNLVIKYGKKAVEKLGPKVLEKIKKNFRGMSSFFSTDEEFPAQLQNFEGRTQTDIQQLKEKVDKLERLVEGLQSVLLKEWNTTESGSKYRLFEERKNWETAEKHCQGFGAHLAIIDNEAKNNFVRNLINSSDTSDFAWIGMKTKTTTQSATFTNFDSESPIDGCAVMDSKGVWSIRSCVQLRPFVCQLVKTNLDL